MQDNWPTIPCGPDAVGLDLDPPFLANASPGQAPVQEEPMSDASEYLNEEPWSSAEFGCPDVIDSFTSIGLSQSGNTTLDPDAQIATQYEEVNVPSSGSAVEQTLLAEPAGAGINGRKRKSMTHPLHVQLSQNDKVTRTRHGRIGLAEPPPPEARFQ